MADTPTETEQMSEEERRMMSEWEAMAGDGDGGSVQPDFDAMPEADGMGGGDGGVQHVIELLAWWGEHGGEGLRNNAGVGEPAPMRRVQQTGKTRKTGKLA